MAAAVESQQQTCSAVSENFNCLPSDDPYRHKTQQWSCAWTTRVCMPNFVAVRRAVSEEIAHTEKKTEWF